MTTTTAETPDGERLARLEIRVENLELQVAQIRDAIRGLRREIQDLRTKIDRNLLWTLGITIPMWATVMAAVLFK